MHGVKPSRWTMAYFGVALISLLAAEAAIAGGALSGVGGVSGPVALATVHLVTLGWLTTLMLGALQQFAPVIAMRTLDSQAAALVALILIVAGLAAMEDGFLQMGGGAASWLLPAGGAVAVAGLVTAATNVALTLLKARPLPFHARFVAAGLAFLALTMLLGLTFAFADAGSGTPLADRLVAFGLPIHMAVGIGGWLTLTAMGVSYKLLAMFTLSPEERGRPGEATLWLSAGGLGLAIVTSLVAVLAGWQGGTADALEVVGGLAAATGVGVFLWDMRRLYRARKRRQLELSASCGVLALVGFGVAAALSLAAFLHPAFPLVKGAAAGMLFLWLGGLGLTQLYKIVPFLTWIERFGPRLGQGPVPRVQDLVAERRTRPFFLLYFAAAAALVTGVATTAAPLAEGAAAFMFVATAGIAMELARVRFGQPAAKDLDRSA